MKLTQPKEKVSKELGLKLIETITGNSLLTLLNILLTGMKQTIMTSEIYAVDTNVLIYLYDSNNHNKRTIAQKIKT